MALEAEAKRKVRSVVDDLERYLDFTATCSPEEYDYMMEVEYERFPAEVAAGRATPEELNELYSAGESP